MQQPGDVGHTPCSLACLTSGSQNAPAVASCILVPMEECTATGTYPSKGLEDSKVITYWLLRILRAEGRVPLGFRWWAAAASETL